MPPDSPPEQSDPVRKLTNTGREFTESEATPDISISQHNWKKASTKQKLKIVVKSNDRKEELLKEHESMLNVANSFLSSATSLIQEYHADRNGLVTTLGEG